MKKLLFITYILSATFSFSQNGININKFEVLDSDIGATINIVKSPDYGISLSGDVDKVDQIKWEVMDETLKITSGRPDTDFSEVSIIVSTPAIAVVELTDGGLLTMDEKFSQIENFVVSAIDSATVDLSNIDFKNLTANAKDGGSILYGSTRNLVSSTDDGGKIRRADRIN